MKTRYITILALLPALLLFTLVGCDSTGETAIADTPAPSGGSNNADTSGEDAKNSNSGGDKEVTGKPPSVNPISDPDSGNDGGKTSPPSDEATNETTDPSTNGGTAQPETTTETTDPSTGGGTAEPEPSPPAPPALPEWTGGGTPPTEYVRPSPGYGYEGGSVVFHNGKYYKSKGWTNSEPTGNGDGNWDRVRPDGQPWLQTGLDNITAYDPNLTYGGLGYYVTYNGGTYKSKHHVSANSENVNNAPAGCGGGSAWERWERVEKPDGSSEYKKYFRPGAANVKPWCSTVAYPGASYHVTYNGATYKSKWFISAGNIPGATAWSPWELVP